MEVPGWPRGHLFLPRRQTQTCSGRTLFSLSEQSGAKKPYIRPCSRQSVPRRHTQTSLLLAFTAILRALWPLSLALVRRCLAGTRKRRFHAPCPCFQKKGRPMVILCRMDEFHVRSGRFYAVLRPFYVLSGHYWPPATTFCSRHGDSSVFA